MKSLRVFGIVLLGLLSFAFAAAADHPPKVTKSADAMYPFELFRNKVAGYAIAEFVVAKDGSIQTARIVEASHRDFEMPVLISLSRWKFKPATKAGVAVDARMRIRFDFDPKRKEASPSPQPVPEDKAER